MNYLLTFADKVGFYAPFILAFLMMFVLQNKQIYFYFFFIGYLINLFINISLRFMIKDPRPNTNPELLNMMRSNKKPIDPRVYGMPSGHAQGTAYTAGFLFYLFRTVKDVQIWFYLSVLLTLWTMAQRVIQKDHSIPQVTVGAILGFTIGYLVFKYSEKQISGSLDLREDDESLQVENFIH